MSAVHQIVPIARAPLNLFVPALRISAHVFTPPPDAVCHFVRIFANPEKKDWIAEDFDPETGQPWKPYFMTLFLWVIDGEAEVCGAVTLPTFCLPALRKLGRQLFIRRFKWQSWDETRMLKLEPQYIDV